MAATRLFPRAVLQDDGSAGNGPGHRSSIKCLTFQTKDELNIFSLKREVLSSVSVAVIG